MTSNWKSRLTLKHDCRIKAGPDNTLEVFYDDSTYRIEIPPKDISLALIGDPRVINSIARTLLGSEVVGYKRLNLVQTFNHIRRNGIYIQKEPSVERPMGLSRMNTFLESVLSNARISGSGLYDPLVVIHRLLSSPWHFAEPQIFYDRVRAIESNSERLKNITSLYLWQHWYMARTAVKSISPAMKQKAFRPALNAHINKISNRSAIVKEYLNSLSQGSGDKVILWETRKFVGKLRNVATFNPLAFAVAIAIFEQGYHKSEINLDLLLGKVSAFNTSIDLLDDRHRSFKPENYHKLSMELAAALGPVVKSSVINAIYTFYNFKFSMRSLYQKLLLEMDKN